MPDDKANKKDRKTRQQIYDDVGYKAQFPEITHFSHVINYLNELGIAKSGFHGHTALEWRDIESWSNMTHTCLETWETRFLIDLSKLYCGCLNEYVKPMAPAPYKTDEDEMAPVRKVADNKIRGLLNGR